MLGDTLKLQIIITLSKYAYIWWGFEDGILQFGVFTILCFKWSMKEHCVATILLAIWGTFLYEINCKFIESCKNKDKHLIFREALFLYSLKVNNCVYSSSSFNLLCHYVEVDRIFWPCILVFFPNAIICVTISSAQ